MSDWKDDLTIITKQVAVNMKKYVERYSFTDDASQKPCGLYGISDLDLEDAFNMQRFDPGKGFFTWHCETGADSNSYRQIVWMVYLNDIKEVLWFFCFPSNFGFKGMRLYYALVAEIDRNKSYFLGRLF